MYVIPVVPTRDPITKRRLPDAGKDVPETAFWMRRVRCGDVLVSEPPQVVTVISDRLQSDEGEEF